MPTGQQSRGGECRGCWPEFSVWEVVAAQIGVGSLALGVWRIRSILVPGGPPYVTAVDLAFSLVILLLLGASSCAGCANPPKSARHRARLAPAFLVTVASGASLYDMTPLVTLQDVQATRMASPHMIWPDSNRVANLTPERYTEALERLRKKGIQP